MALRFRRLIKLTRRDKVIVGHQGTMIEILVFLFFFSLLISLQLLLLSEPVSIPDASEELPVGLQMCVCLLCKCMYL